MRWILDDGPLDLLSGLVSPGNLGTYPSGRLLIASTTQTAARSSKARSDLLLTEQPDGGQLIGVFEVQVDCGDPAEEALFGLHRQEKTTTNLAEHEAIAWALVHGQDAVFVTSDRRAALTALAELGRARVAHPFDLWLDLLEMGAFGGSIFRDLCDRTRKADQGLERMPARISARFVVKKRG